MCRKISISQNNQNCNLNREAESDDETVDLGAAYFHTNPNSLNIYIYIYIAMSRRDHEKQWDFAGSLGLVLMDALEESLGYDLQHDLQVPTGAGKLGTETHHTCAMVKTLYMGYIGVWPSIP